MRILSQFFAAPVLAFAGLLLLLAAPASAHDPEWSIAIHGGAGTMSPERMDAETRAEYEAALQAALDAGSKVLAEGGTAMDAVVAAITLMEDDPKFNAGRGAVFSARFDPTSPMDDAAFGAAIDDFDKSVAVGFQAEESRSLLHAMGRCLRHTMRTNAPLAESRNRAISTAPASSQAPRRCASAPAAAHHKPPPKPAHSQRVMAVLDSINAKWGRGTLRPGVVPATPAWSMRRELMSQSFTTRVDQLWKVSVR